MERTRAKDLPVTLAELKEWNYIEGTDFDSKLQQCLKGAITAVESYINQIVWRSDFNETFPGVPHLVPIDYYPVDTVGVSVDNVSVPADDYAWDGRVLSIAASVTGQSTTVTFKAGYEEAPDDIKSAILLIASELFRNPTDSVKQLPTASKLLLDPHRIACV